MVYADVSDGRATYGEAVSRREKQPEPAILPVVRKATEGPVPAIPMPPGVKVPPINQVPDWSPATQALMAHLSDAEKAFVEWYVIGKNAAEAYRNAFGNQDAPRSKVEAYRMKNRPEV